MNRLYKIHWLKRFIQAHVSHVSYKHDRWLCNIYREFCDKAKIDKFISADELLYELECR